MPAAQKRVKMLADIVGARGGSRAEDDNSRPVIRLDHEGDARQLLEDIRERAKALVEAPPASGAAPAGKLSTVAIDRPGSLLETKQPRAKKPRASRLARMPSPTGKAAAAVEKLLYRKGAATAATFRPDYWTFDTDTPEADPQRARQGESKTPRSRSPRSR